MLLEAIKAFCLKQGLERTYHVALSGGLDSIVLLYLLVNVRSFYPIRLNAIHIHHGLSPHADHWGLHCQTICHKWDVDFIQHTIQVKPFNSQSLEECARKGRYDLFQQALLPDDILLTAHHQNDQAETVLLQLFRGAGPKGLAAMPSFAAFGKGHHARPLLDFSRAELQNFAEHNQLHWVEDESNAHVNFTRNFIRHNIMPLLQMRWPSVSETLTRVASHCAEAQTLLESYVQQDLTMCFGSKPETLSVKKLLQLDRVRQRQVLRLWFTQSKHPIPSTVKMKHILNDVLNARVDKQPHIVWGCVELRRYRDDLYVMKCLSPYHPAMVLTWNSQNELVLPDGRVLHGLDIKTVSVRFRQGNEVCQLLGRAHHHSLKKLFQAWGVPPWLRDRVPLIFVDDQLVCAVGFFLAEELSVSE